MKITRTANAGVLLEIDNTSVLLDGVCEDFPPYIGTPDSVRNALLKNPPDVLAFTHEHKDHYDKSFVETYNALKLGSVIGPEFSMLRGLTIDIKSVPTRHIGKPDVAHISFVILASKCIWFMGDASPSELKKLDGFPKPDVLIVPYAYTITESAWKMTKNSGAKDIVLLHLPDKTNDEYNLWEAVSTTVNGDLLLKVPDIGQGIGL